MTYDLTQYIKHRLDQGHSQDDIKAALVAAGWTEEQLGGAFALNRDNASVAPHAPHTEVSDGSQGKITANPAVGVRTSHNSPAQDAVQPAAISEPILPDQATVGNEVATEGMIRVGEPVTEVKGKADGNYKVSRPSSRIATVVTVLVLLLVLGGGTAWAFMSGAFTKFSNPSAKEALAQIALAHSEVQSMKSTFSLVLDLYPIGCSECGSDEAEWTLGDFPILGGMFTGAGRAEIELSGMADISDPKEPDSAYHSRISYESTAGDTAVLVDIEADVRTLDGYTYINLIRTSGSMPGLSPLTGRWIEFGSRDLFAFGEMGGDIEGYMLAPNDQNAQTDAAEVSVPKSNPSLGIADVRELLGLLREHEPFAISEMRALDSVTHEGETTRVRRYRLMVDVAALRAFLKEAQFALSPEMTISERVELEQAIDEIPIEQIGLTRGIEIAVGKDDNLLREVVVPIEIAASDDVPYSASGSFTARLSHYNEPVRVERPGETIEAVEAMEIFLIGMLGGEDGDGNFSFSSSDVGAEKTSTPAKASFDSHMQQEDAADSSFGF